MADSFLRELSVVLDQTIPKKAAGSGAIEKTPVITDSKEDDMQDGMDEDTNMDGTAAADNRLASSTSRRGFAFLQTHVRQYQQRIEDLLAYLQEFRFGRQTPATAHIQQLQKSAADLQADVRSLESEWATWLLLIELRRADETIHQPAIPPSIQERYSALLIANRLVGTPGGSIGRILRILNWLEELQVYLLRIEENGSVSMRSTLRRLQRSHEGDQQKDWIDPDVELRLKANHVLPVNAHVFEKQDVDEEARLLEYVWQLIRAGRLTEAIQLCRTYQQHWRAASLQGGERWHDEGGVQADGSVFRVGNTKYALWRYTCRKLSQAAGVSAVESAIYGLLGGDLQSAVKYAGQYKYEDALYCYLRVLVDEEVDEFIRKEGKQDPTTARIPKPERAIPLESSLVGVLSSLESPLNTLLTPAVSTQATQNPYIRLQKWLMLDDVERVEQELVQTIKTQYKGTNSPVIPENGINHTYLLFACHIYLYLHPRCPHQEPLNEAGIFLIQTYLAYLESNPTHHPLVASYAQYLSSPQRVQFYIRFLKRIPSLSARQLLLQDLSKFNPENSLEITTGLVQNIIGEDVQEKPAHMLQLTSGAPVATPGFPSLSTPAATVPNLLASTTLTTSGVTQSDLDKISSVDCFALTGGHVEMAVVQEALIQAIQLYRSFVLREKYAAAKRFAQHLTEKMWEHHIFTIVQQQQQKQEPLPQLWHSLDREYNHWRLYIKCLNWYDAWLTHQTVQPKQPTFPLNSFQTTNQAKAEYHIFAQKYDRYVKDLESWKNTQRQTVQSCVIAFTESLEVEGGWLNPVEGSLRVSELHELRQLCIPRLVSMLIQICQESEQHQLVLPLADVLASPTNTLYTCFTPEQLRAILKQLRLSYIEVHLKQPRLQQHQNQESNME